MNDSSGVLPLGPEDRRFVYAVARRIVGSEADADDVTQDALLLAHRHRDAFRGESSYRTWLYRIATMAALGELRRRRRSRIRLVEDDRERSGIERHIERHEAPVVSAQRQLEELEERAALHGAIARLPAVYREVLLARADASEQAVATRLGISVANVKVRSFRARQQVREAIQRQERAAAA